MKIKKKQWVTLSVWLGLLLLVLAINYPRLWPLKVRSDAENPDSPLLTMLLVGNEVNANWSWNSISTKQSEIDPTSENFYLNAWVSRAFLGSYKGETARIVQKISLYEYSEKNFRQKITNLEISLINKEKPVKLSLSPMGENPQEICVVNISKISCTVFGWYGNIHSELSIVLSVNVNETEVTEAVNSIIAIANMKITRFLPPHISSTNQP